MKFSIFSHREAKTTENSRELRRDDVECYSDKDLKRHKSALEQEGWKVNAVLDTQIAPGENTGRRRTGQRRR